jgi:HemY protein
MPVSPVTGRLDAFQWKDPIAGLDTNDAVIEHDKELRAASALSQQAAEPARDFEPESKSAEIIAPSSLPATSTGRPMARTPASAVPIAPIVPLVHVPDDPGPDARPLVEPEREQAPESGQEGWRKLRGLFK